MKLKLSNVFMLVLVGMSVLAVDAQACRRVCRPCGGGHGGGGGGRYYGGRPYYGAPYYGGGRKAFNRSRRMRRRSRRAAWMGWGGRAYRLNRRANWAYNRGVYRYNYPYWI